MSRKPRKPTSRQLAAGKSEGIETEGRTGGSIMRDWRLKKQHEKFLSIMKGYNPEPNKISRDVQDMSEEERKAWDKLNKTDFSSDAEADFIEAQNKSRK